MRMPRTKWRESWSSNGCGWLQQPLWRNIGAQLSANGPALLTLPLVDRHDLADDGSCFKSSAKSFDEELVLASPLVSRSAAPPCEASGELADDRRLRKTLKPSPRPVALRAPVFCKGWRMPRHLGSLTTEVSVPSSNLRITGHDIMKMMRRISTNNFQTLDWNRL